jgi:hypothetical protein
VFLFMTELLNRFSMQRPFSSTSNASTPPGIARCVTFLRKKRHALGNTLRDNRDEIATTLNHVVMATELATAGMILAAPMVDNYERRRKKSLNPFRQNNTITPEEINTHDAKLNGSDGEEDPHWLNRAGYATYALSSPVKQVASGITSVELGNPTSLFGMGALIPIYPMMMLNHGFWTKLAILVTCQVATVGQGNIDKHTTETAIEKETARLEGRPPREIPMRQCAELGHVVRWPALTRLASGKLTPEDKQHWKGVGRFMVEDQRIAFQNSVKTAKDIGTLASETSKRILNGLHRGAKRTPLLRPLMEWATGHSTLPSRYVPKIPEVFRHSANFFQLHQTGAMASYFLMLGQALGRVLGLKQVTDPVAQAGLLLTAPMLYCSMLQQSHQLWHKGGSNNRFLAGSRAIAALAMLVGDIFWFKTWGFGVYRAGSSGESLFRNETRNQLRNR